jgi:hypothetical protein
MIGRDGTASDDRAPYLIDRRTVRQRLTIDTCVECGRPVEIVSRGLCAACYMRGRREIDVDPHRTPPRQRMSRKKMRTAHAGMLNYAEDFGFTDPIEETVPDPDAAEVADGQLTG